MTGRLVVLASGYGSNLQALIDATLSGQLDAEVAAVVSNYPDAYALTRAQEAGIDTVLAPHQHTDRALFDEDLAYTVAGYAPHLVVLAGWDRILTSRFVHHHVTINLHPAKPGTFKGLGAIERAFAAWQQGEIESGGVMVHYVPDEGVDDGPVIGWEPVPFEPDDTLDTFSARVHQSEHRLLVSSVKTALARELDRV